MPPVEIGVTDGQLEAIAELRSRVLPALTPKLLKDETLYYRFLKARDFNVDKAEEMVRKHLLLRQVYGIENMETDYIPDKYISKYLVFGILGVNKQGSVVMYSDIGKADHRGTSNLFTYRQILTHVMSIIEESLRIMQKKSEKIGKPITKFNIIFNTDELTLIKASCKRSLDMFLEGFQAIQDLYPERIDEIYVINAPSIFNVFFSVIKTVLAGALIDKIQIYGRTGWKEVLLSKIDADELPAFLGGNRTDPDGDPLCKSFIIHGQQIPQELFAEKSKKSLSDVQGVERLCVNRFSQSEVEFRIDEANTYVEFEFEVKKMNILFGLFYRKKSELEVLIPKRKVDTLFYTEVGLYKCEKVGTYVMVFDNTYSWLFSKEIYYRLSFNPKNTAH